MQPSNDGQPPRMGHDFGHSKDLCHIPSNMLFREMRSQHYKVSRYRPAISQNSGPPCGSRFEICFFDERSCSGPSTGLALGRRIPAPRLSLKENSWFRCFLIWGEQCSTAQCPSTTSSTPFQDHSIFSKSPNVNCIAVYSDRLEWILQLQSFPDAS